MYYEECYGESREDLLRPWEPEAVEDLTGSEQVEMDLLVARYWELDFKLADPHIAPDEAEDAEYEKAGIIEDIQGLCRNHWDNYKEVAEQYIEEGAAPWN